MRNEVPPEMKDCKSLVRRQRIAWSVMAIVLIMQIFAAGSVNAAAGHDAAGRAEILNSVVQVYTRTSDPSYLTPWAMLPENRVVGTGFVIEGQRILTSAHVVANQKTVSVRKALGSELYAARVFFAAHDTDLAVLTIDDEAFFRESVPLDIADVPALPLHVEVYGFPEEETPFISEGILSALGHRKYCHSSTSLLAGEIHAEITTGFSGGPVIHGGMVVGVMIQASRNGTVAHMVPFPVIEHFLQDIGDGQYDGIPDIGLVTQESVPDGEDAQGTGITVQHIIAGSPAGGKIKEQDVLLSIGGHKVGNDGSIMFRPGMRTDYRHAVEMKQVGDIVSAQILRNGVVSTVSFILDKKKEDFLLIPNEEYDSRPSYFILGGIVFTPLTRNVLNAWDHGPAGLDKGIPDWPSSGRQRLVVAVDVLPDKANERFAHVKGWVITEVNGRPVRDFQHFFETVADASGKTIVLKALGGRQLVLDRVRTVESTARILAAYGIEEDRSPDLRHLRVASRQ